MTGSSVGAGVGVGSTVAVGPAVSTGLGDGVWSGVGDGVRSETGVAAATRARGVGDAKGSRIDFSTSLKRATVDKSPAATAAASQ